MRHHYVIGLSYRTATVEERERMVLSLPLDLDLMAELSPIGIEELVWVSTCNRCEFYFASSREDFDQVFADFRKWWFGRAGLDSTRPQNLLYAYGHRDAVEHLYRVAASLDSLLLGESQILGQLREAYLHSVELGRVKLFLHHLFQSALALGKDVRAQTGIGRGALSISLAAVQMCRKVFGDLHDKTAVVYGAGEMAHLAGLHLRQAGISRLYFCNRTLEKARLLAERHQGEAIAWEHRAELLPSADLLISATSSPQFVLEKSQVQSKKWGYGPKVLIDIAIPRDLDPGLGELPGTFLFVVDDLQNVMEEGKRQRQSAVEEVEKILCTKSNEFVEWYKSRESVPAIVCLRSAYEKEMQTELAKWQSHPAFDAIQSALHALGGRLLHRPSEALRQLGGEGMGPEASELIARLFDAPQNKD